MTSGSHILLLDDDSDYAMQLSAYLEAHGYRVRAVRTPAAFEAAIRSAPPDLVLLDQRLGETTGTDILRRMRRHSETPCIVVTGMPDPTDRIVNLEIGADDEIAKSVQPRELLARIGAVLRRQARVVGARPGRQTWSFDIGRRELRRPDGGLCPLTTAEFEMLRVLVEHSGEPVAREKLMECVFGRRLVPGDRAVDTVVQKLRRKVSPDEPDGFIKSVRQVGYAFVGFPVTGRDGRAA